MLALETSHARDSRIALLLGWPSRGPPTLATSGKLGSIIHQPFIP